VNAQLVPVENPQPDRRRFIGGSDVAAVLGISPWTTPLQLWERKTRPALEGGEHKAVFKRGHRWESVVAEMLVERLEANGHKVEIVGQNKRYEDPQRRYLAAEIDFELRLDGEREITNVELKTVHPFKASEWGREDTDESPVWYTAQAMHGLGVTGRSRCLVAPLFGADEIRTYPIVRDDETIEAMRARCAAFWQLVETGVRPDPTTLADLDRLYHGDPVAPALIADEELTRAALRLRAIHAEIKARELEAAAIEFGVKRAMQDATELVIPNDDKKVAIVWKNRDYTWFDQSALKEADAKLHRQFQRKTTTRVFTVK
jgi:putative phage-type endonuclease